MRAPIAAFALMAFGFATSPQARDYGWAHHSTRGEAGQREVVIYDQDSIDEAISPDLSILPARRGRDVMARVRFATVFEDAAQPGMVATDYTIHCRSRLSSPSTTYTYWRDGVVTSESSDQFSPIEQGTPLADLMETVCKWAPKDDRARRRAMVQPFSRADLPIADAWTVLLPGATRPSANATKSEAQLADEAVERARMDAYRRQSAIEDEKNRKALAERAAEDRAFLEDLLAWKATAGNGGNPAMHSWIGSTVSELMAAWGRPDEVRGWGAGQQLIYSSYASQTIFQGNMPIGREDYSCHKSFFTDRGYVVTWKMEGNRC